MSSRTWFTLLALVVSTGCTAPSQQRVPFPAQDVTVTRPDLARIYFVREQRTGVQRSAIHVFDGQIDIGALSPDTYLCWERPGGRTLGRAFYAAVDPGRGEIEGIVSLDCAAGTVCYYNVTVDREEGKPTVQLLDAAEGRRLVAERTPANKP